MALFARWGRGVGAMIAGRWSWAQRRVQARHTSAYSNRPSSGRDSRSAMERQQWVGAAVKPVTRSAVACWDQRTQAWLQRVTAPKMKSMSNPRHPSPLAGRSVIRSLRGPISRGFTLVELIFVVGIVAILAAVAAPGVTGFITSRRVEDVAQRLNDSISQGRIEAVKRNVPILLCADASITNGACNLAPVAADWAKGWRLCYDADGDGVCDVATADNPNPIRLQAAVNPTVRLTGPTSRLRFNPNGSLSASSFVEFEARPDLTTTPRWLVRFAASGAFSIRKG